MTVMVEVPKFNMSDVIPGGSDKVHPAFIGPDGVVRDSIQVELEPWVALSILRSLKDLYLMRSRQMETGEKLLDPAEYQKIRWAVILMKEQIKELEVQIRNETETT